MRKYGSSQNHSFAQIPSVQVPRSSFNRSSGLKTTFPASSLIPIWCDEALPGDTFNMKMTTFVRQATPLHPILDNMYIDSFFFAVPIRLIWENWEKMNGAQDNPGDTTTFLVPQIIAAGTGGHLVGGLSDYLGIPTGVEDLTHSSLWHRAYNLIWNEWFRSENIANSATVDTDDGPDAISDYSVRTRHRRHDYFTSCNPWPQKGTSVTLPLGSEAKVHTGGTIGQAINVVQDSIPAARDLVANTATAEIGASAATPAAYLYADLSTATAATINELREAFQIQKIYERDARGGTRYTEILLSHFGVQSDDARLQRPEFLGGGHQTINVTPIPQTSTTSGAGEDDQLGNLGAYATSSGGNHGFVKSFTEHCVLIGIINARADHTEQHGLARMFSRRTRWDFYWPSFAHLGEQAVLQKEIFAVGTMDGGPAEPNVASDDLIVFGYQERFAEYRYAPSRVTGEFRSTFAQSLDPWHLAIDWGDPGTATPPTLNTAFINEQVPMVRINAVSTSPDFLGDFYFQLNCARPMPTFSVPGMIDHF